MHLYFIDFNWFDIVILPLMIFFARIMDVSIGTVRIILVAKGYKKIAPIAGFFEVLIWIIAITRIVENLDNWICYIAYAGGFATGNFVGMIIEERLALGYEMVRIITKKEADDLIDKLRKKGYGTTSVDAKGNLGDVAVIYVIVSRKKLKQVIDLISKFNPRALYTIEDIRYVSKDVFFSTSILKKK